MCNNINDFMANLSNDMNKCEPMQNFQMECCNSAEFVMKDEISQWSLRSLHCLGHSDRWSKPPLSVLGHLAGQHLDNLEVWAWQPCGLPRASDLHAKRQQSKQSEGQQANLKADSHCSGDCMGKLHYLHSIVAQHAQILQVPARRARCA